MKAVVRLAFVGLILAVNPSFAQSESKPIVTLNSYGSPGMIDLPTAEPMADAMLSFGFSHFTTENRNFINFQFHPKINLGFKYSRIRDFEGLGDRFDRSLSIQLSLINETEFTPSFSIGVTDALGTGINSSEFLVASKTIGSNLRFNAGIGFGRLAGRPDFENPFSIFGDFFKNRAARDYFGPDDAIGEGGTVQIGQLFRGDGAFFGGVEWHARQNLLLTAEYSPDIYPGAISTFAPKSPLNFGVRYIGKQGYDLSAYYLQGATVGLMATTYLNPKQPAFGPGRDPAPPPISPANEISLSELGWSSASDVSTGTTSLAAALERQQITLTKFYISADTAFAEVIRSSYSRPAQVIGRTARVLTRTMPPSIKTFNITLVSTGIKGSEVVLEREMLEANENHYDGSWRSYLAADFKEPKLKTAVPVLEAALDRDLSVTPYVKSSYFDPDDPYRGDVGIQVRGTYEMTEGSYLQGILRQRIVGTLSESKRVSDSILPKVRSESNLYDKHGDLLLTELTYNYRYQVTPSLFTRATVGYLEPAFAGISTEVLWKPFDKRYGLGLELNYVNQREFDQHFDLRDYKVGTGHMSFYYDIGSGYHGQIDLGRYLAGDWGGTLSLAREFENGWRLGAFATLTDVPFEDFGEGSFDKGFQISIPTNIATGEPTSNVYSTTLRPIMRDGGAKLNVAGRLYGAVRELQKPELADSWGRFWK